MKELNEALAEKAVMASQKQLHILKTLSSTLASVSRVEPQPSVSAVLRALKQLLASSSTDVQLQALGCIKRLLELNAALQQNVAQFQKEMASASNTLLPPLTAPAKNDLASLYQSLRQFVSEGCGKKEKDWFPYPQLYPPGTLLHLRNNPTIGKQDDYALMEAVADRCQGKRPSTRFGSAGDEKKGVEMVEVDKEEFDHYSLDVSLIEDHRMGNYVWGLCKYYDSLKRDA